VKKSQLAIIQSIRAQLDALERALLAKNQIRTSTVISERLQSLFPMVADNYDLESAGERWITCAQICEELSIDPSRSNCNRLGQSIPQSIPRRRSQGKKLLLMPPLLEKF
jgi:hypothetical protein